MEQDFIKCSLLSKGWTLAVRLGPVVPGLFSVSQTVQRCEIESRIILLTRDRCSKFPKIPCVIYFMAAK